jgi:hypothetical protein
MEEEVSRPMRILLGTNHFQEIAGSELVILEFAELFRQMEHEVCICANFLGAPMKRMAERAECELRLADESINAFEFDLVMVINQIAPLLRYEKTDAMRPATRFVFMHVDLNFTLSQPGLVHEPMLADEIWLHSAEARDYFVEQVLAPSKTYLFHNAAPSRFWRPERSYQQELKSVLFVSNHLPEELEELKTILAARRIAIMHLGRNGDEYGRLGPKTLLEAGAVISMGKTAQYCLATRTPLFVYDHFGGPGYLTEQNLDRAAWFNFSGRCCQRELHAEGLADELIDGYYSAISFMQELPDQARGRFRLRPKLLRLLERIPESSPNVERLLFIEQQRLAMRHEQALAKAAGMFHQMWRGAHLTVQCLKAQ